MRKIRIPILLSVCIAGIFIASCRKFSANPSWDTQILAPLITANLSINDLVTDSLVHSNVDSSITLVYNGSLYNLNTDSLVKIPDTSLTYGYVVSGVVNPGDNIVTPTGTWTKYGSGSAQLTKATIQSGYLVVTVSSYVPGVIDFNYSIPSATLGGNPFTASLKANPAIGSNPTTTIDSFPLNNYQLDLTGQYHNAYNSIYTTVSAIFDPSNPSINIGGADGVGVNVTFHNVVPYYAQGYFGTITKSFTQTSPFSIFKKISGGSLSLQSLNVSLTLQNDIGVDAKVTIDSITSINPRNGKPVALTDGSLINNAILINRATQTYNPANPVIPSIQTFNLTPSNSNILQWIDNLPSSVGYTVNVTTDPIGNVSGSHDFAFFGYGIESNLNISMPLSLIATNLTLADTLPINLASTAQAQNIKSGTFTLYADNGFAFSAGLQIYLLGTNMKVTDSLMSSPQTIQPGILNGLGEVTSVTTSTVKIPLSETQTKTLLGTKNIIIMARFNMGSLPSTYRKIYNYNTLGIKLVGNFDYLVN